MSIPVIQLTEDKTYKWFTNGTIWLKGNFFDPDHNYYSNHEALDYVTRQLEELSLSELVKKLNGIFTILCHEPERITMATDPINFFPVFYAFKDSQWLVSDDLSLMLRQTNYNQLNNDAIPGFLAAGFVMDNETLIKNLLKTQAGELVSLSGEGTLSRKAWYYFLPEQFNSSPLPELTDQLHEHLDALSQRMITMLNGRTAVVPLSGGYDSRLIASLLKKAGYENTICITYGKKNPEVDISREVAKNLGFQWIFVDYENSDTAGFVDDPEFVDYARYMGKGYSMPYLQEFFAARELKRQKRIPDDAVFLPGHTGDYIAGSYVLKTAKTTKKEKPLFGWLRQKYFWFVQTSRRDNTIIEDKLQHLFTQYKNHLNPDTGFNIFIEDWDIREKIAKFIFHSSHVFPFFGYEIYFPLWDKELVSFFRHVPFHFRENKMLYDKTLEECLFKPYNIFFAEKELKALPPKPWMANIKGMVKPFVPASLKIKKLKQNDYICYSAFNDDLKVDLKNNGEEFPRHINSFNAIICRWYVSFLKKELETGNREIG
jgi:asparagine synthase (glutamine-hydrolysing)